MDILLLYFEGCPHWQAADARLAALGSAAPAASKR